MAKGDERINNLLVILFFCSSFLFLIMKSDKRRWRCDGYSFPSVRKKKKKKKKQNKRKRLVEVCD